MSYGSQEEERKEGRSFKDKVAGYIDVHVFSNHSRERKKCQQDEKQAVKAETVVRTYVGMYVRPSYVSIRMALSYKIRQEGGRKSRR